MNTLGETDHYLIGEGTHKRLWEALGAHCVAPCAQHQAGVRFAVWAPNAERVAVLGDFTDWSEHPLSPTDSGVWEGFVEGAHAGQRYKFAIHRHGHCTHKADPMGRRAEPPPATASIIAPPLQYDWQDQDWMASRAQRHHINAPISIYEVQLGSWRHPSLVANTYQEFAHALVDYACEMGFTHIELLPISEYPFDGSWGYQPVGLYAPTCRFGDAQALCALVERAHQCGLGIILDWVPAHFPADVHGLVQFDGTPLYEHADPREGFHQDWNTLIYNFGRTEVENFLVANALYWFEQFHIDGLRVDAVASMLYRDYSREDWVPNRDGGRENYEAIAFLKRLNSEVYAQFPGAMMIAEESTSFPAVSAPVDSGGLGFGYKWNMGWMNDSLGYFALDPVYRKHHHHQLTFGLHYAWSENFILPISHDEVVHGKQSMLHKMPGDEAQRFAQLRAFYAWMWAHPGKKLLFMGCEIAQAQEWNHNQGLDWATLGHPLYAGVQRLVRELNTLYRATSALHQSDARASGFQWLEANDAEHSILAFLRRAEDGTNVVVVANLTPVAREHYRLGFPYAGAWTEVLNTDSVHFGGHNTGNMGCIQTQNHPHHGQECSACITLPASSVLIFNN